MVQVRNIDDFKTGLNKSLKDIILQVQVYLHFCFLEQKSVNSFWKGPESKYFRLRGWFLCQCLKSAVVAPRQHSNMTVNKRGCILIKVLDRVPPGSGLSVLV